MRKYPRLAAVLLSTLAGCGDSNTMQPRDDMQISGCQSDNDCKGAARKCDPNSHACVGCVGSGDCADGMVCDPKSQGCVPGCSTQKACPNGMVCDTNGGMCVGCLVDGDCKDQQKPHCDTTSHTCAACASDGDCPLGQICKNDQCTTGCTMAHGCDNGQSCCDGACVDLDSDAKNCGACGTACNNGRSCCAKNCADLTNDIKNCGSCGMTCSAPNATASCAAMACGIGSCNAGFGNCDNIVANGCETSTDSDLNNCGGCGTVCSFAHATALCGNGQCAIGTCDRGFADCNNQSADGCETDTTIDQNNCGGCGIACNLPNAVTSCSNSMCLINSCGPGFADCDGQANDGCEVSTSNDPNNCGGCGIVCMEANGTPSCNNGMCGLGMCNNGFSNCNGNLADGCEINLTNDPNNCGMCLKVCVGANANMTCTNGGCTIGSCQGTFADCNNSPADGCELNTGNDVNNCGGCGVKCGAVPNGTVGCGNSKCTITSCTNGMKDCNLVEGDGCESNPQTDPKNCGGCGMACGNGASCQGGKCICGNQLVDDGNTLCVPLGSTYTTSGDHCYTSQVVIAGTVLVAPISTNGSGILTIRSPSITVSGTGKILADAAGSVGGAPAPTNGGHQGSGGGIGCGGGPGADVGQGGSGGGYGGAGATPSLANPFKPACDRCDSPTVFHCEGAPGGVFGTDTGTDLAPGSGGGAGGNSFGCMNAGGRGGAGGGQVTLLAGTLSITGTISANGEKPPIDGSPCVSNYHPGGGGGAGGGLILRGATITGSGTYSVVGGAGGDSTGLNGDWGWAGGGGGGGRMKIFVGNNQFVPLINVGGGAGGSTCAGANCYAGAAGATGVPSTGPIPPGLATINCGGL